MPSKTALELAAQAWTTDENKYTVMDANLATTFAEILDKYIANAMLLRCLKDAGVDNWGGFDIAMDKFREWE